MLSWWQLAAQVAHRDLVGRGIITDRPYSDLADSIIRELGIYTDWAWTWDDGPQETVNFHAIRDGWGYWRTLTREALWPVEGAIYILATAVGIRDDINLGDGQEQQ